MIPDDYYMKLALDEAYGAAARGDVPVGAVLVKDNEVISAGSDTKALDPTEHLES